MPDREGTPQHYCVFNKTRESFLSLSVTPANTKLQRLKAFIGRLRLRSDEGVWVTPSQGVHTIRFAFPSDLIYLDGNRRVIQVLESFGRVRLGPLQRNCSSVLELPTRTIHYSQTAVGDELLICSPEEIQTYLRQNQIPEPQSNGAGRGMALTKGFQRAYQARYAPLPRRTKQPWTKRATRHDGSGLVGHYWDGGAPLERPIKDISTSGAYIRTSEPWYPGTVLSLNMKNHNASGKRSNASISVHCQIVRQDPDKGFGVRFAFRNPRDRKLVESFVREIFEDQPLSAWTRMVGRFRGAMLGIL